MILTKVLHRATNNFVSSTLKTRGVEQGLIELLDRGVPISAVCMDRNVCTMKMMREGGSSKDERLKLIEVLVDTWHQQKWVREPIQVAMQPDAGQTCATQACRRN
jgi:hypothetical protein